MWKPSASPEVVHATSADVRQPAGSTLSRSAGRTVSAGGGAAGSAATGAGAADAAGADPVTAPTPSATALAVAIAIRLVQLPVLPMGDIVGGGAIAPARRDHPPAIHASPARGAGDASAGADLAVV
jgi:hypothetical protein